jgi:hypothetical protein
MSSCDKDNRIVKVYSIQPGSGGGGGNVFSGLTVTGDLFVSGTTYTDTIVASIFSGGTYYGDGSNLTGIVTTDNYVTGATFNPTTNAFTLTRSGGLSDIVESINITNVNNLTVNGDLTITGVTNTTQINSTIFSGGTFYGDGSNLTGTVGSDTFTTGATLDGNTIIFNRTDILSAYTVDLSSLVINTSGGTSNIISNTPPSTQFSGSTWIRSTDYESFIYDVNRGKWLSVNTNQFEGSRSRVNQTDVFLRTTDGSPYNLSPYYLSKDITITNVVGETITTGNTFNIIISTGTTISSDTIHTLNVLNLVTDNTSVNVDVSLGSNLYLYMSGNSINYPKSTVYYKYR